MRKSLIYIIIIQLLAASAPAQNRTRYHLPKGYVYRSVRQPFTNVTKQYALEKIPVSAGSKYAYYVMGDMIVGTNKPRTTLAILDAQLLWSGDVPLKIDKSVVDSGMCATLISAINEFHMRTKIRFVPYSNQRDFIDISVGDPGYPRSGVSAVGRRPNGQGIIIKKRAGSDVLIHEMMHALGIIHEHQRPDRDTFIQYNPQNSQYPQLSGDFEIFPWASTFTPYDYTSIMHYSSRAMAKPGTLTLECKKNNRIVPCPAGMSGPRLSEYDIMGLNTLYKNVAFSPATYTTPVINLPATGNEKGSIYISWDYKEVQMRRNIDEGNRLIIVTAKNAFKLKVSAPYSIINFNKCVWAYTNYASYLPVINYATGVDLTPIPPGRPTHIDTIPYASMKMLQLPMPFAQLNITLDVNEAAWTWGKTNSNPYGRHGTFFVWLQPERADNDLQSYTVHGRWMDDRDIQGSIRKIIGTINKESVRRRIISDGPMANPDGYGPGDPR